MTYILEEKEDGYVEMRGGGHHIVIDARGYFHDERAKVAIAMGDTEIPEYDLDFGGGVEKKTYLDWARSLIKITQKPDTTENIEWSGDARIVDSPFEIVKELTLRGESRVSLGERMDLRARKENDNTMKGVASLNSKRVIENMKREVNDLKKKLEVGFKSYGDLSVGEAMAEMKSDKERLEFLNKKIGETK